MMAVTCDDTTFDCVHHHAPLADLGRGAVAVGATATPGVCMAARIPG